MSHSAVALLDPPGTREVADVQWQYVSHAHGDGDQHAAGSVTRLVPRGNGRERYFLVAADELTPLGPEPDQRLPSVDEIID
jgi:hypothetical protein